jgi:GNAT superfamily N-acetyltransferase
VVTLLEALKIKKAEGPLRPFDPFRDMRVVADLVELCFADTLDPDSKSYLERMRAADNNPGLMRWAANAAEWVSAPLSGYVWQEEDRVVGNASLIPHFRVGRRLYLIANVAVHPDYRRRGIGRALTERAVEHARQRNAPSVWLHVRQENETAVNIYRSLSFIERARRTTWWSQDKSIEAGTPSGVTFDSPRAVDWPSQRQWLAQNYPAELRWHMPFNLNLLRPDLWGEFQRFFNNSYVRMWAARRDGKLLGVVAWQSMLAHANALWLAAPSGADEYAVQALLLHTRKRLDTTSPLWLDLPATHLVDCIRKAGFNDRQTLMWMELRLEESALPGAARWLSGQ